MAQAQTVLDGRNKPFRYLFGAFIVQMITAVGFMTFVFLTPNLAEETGLQQRDFGLAVTFIFVGTALSSPMTAFCIRLFGGLGTILVALAAMCFATMILLWGTWTTTMIAAFLFGLGYGPQGPIGMTIVTERTPQHNRGLFLSLRHSAQPLAGVILGRVLPPLMLIYGWQAGVLTSAVTLAFGALFILICAPLFHLRDEATIQRSRLTGRRFDPIGEVRKQFTVPPNLRVLWISGVVFAITQVAMVFFSYVYLLEVVGLSPIAAGIFSSNLQIAGMAARPVFGFVSDRLGSPRLTLIGIGLVSIGASYALMATKPDWSVTAMLLLALACGISGQAWNGVFTAAMGDLVASEKLAEMNGRAFSFLSLGWMAGAPICWTLVETFGSYEPMFYFMMALNAASVIGLIASGRRVPRPDAKVARP